MLCFPASLLMAGEGRRESEKEEDEAREEQGSRCTASGEHRRAQDSPAQHGVRRPKEVRQSLHFFSHSCFCCRSFIHSQIAVTRKAHSESPSRLRVDVQNEMLMIVAAAAVLQGIPGEDRTPNRASGAEDCVTRCVSLIKWISGRSQEDETRLREVR